MTEHLEGPQYSAFMDGELDAGQKTAFERHLTSCGDCSRELESLQQIKIRFGRIAPRTAPPQLLARLRRAHEPRPSRAGKIAAFLRPRTVWRPAAVFAALALTCTFLVVNRSRVSDEFVDLDPLLVAHFKYQGENMVPHADMSQSNYSRSLSSLVRNEN